MRRIALLIALVFTTPALAQSVKVDHPWARATSASATSGGIFLTIVNTGAPDHLVAASTPVAGMAMLHETIQDNGVMKMREVPNLPLDTGKPVELRPGGTHIMLMDLHHKLAVGDKFPVTLTFEKSAPVTVTVEVGAAGASGPGMAHSMP